ncbi:MAG: Sir2 family NAD-dependent protein deacetylase [Thermoanaerobaculia bacterium]
MRDPASELAAAVEGIDDGLLLVVTGAGVSRASGIATFRGSEPDAVWKQSDVSLATFDYFRRDPVGQWQWYLKRFEALKSARPNAAHQALVSLERWQRARAGRFRLVTQNIDTLHEEAGSEEMIKVHGTSDRFRCSRAGCSLGSPTGSLPREDVDLSSFLSEPARQTLPACPVCDAPLRAHVLFFDEYYTEHHDYRFAEVEEMAMAADLILFVGTSFAVGVTDLFLQCGGRRSIPMYSVDPAASRSPQWAQLTAFQAPAEELLPAVCRQLGLTES